MQCEHSFGWTPLVACLGKRKILVTVLPSAPLSHVVLLFLLLRILCFLLLLFSRHFLFILFFVSLPSPSCSPISPLPSVPPLPPLPLPPSSGSHPPDLLSITTAVAPLQSLALRVNTRHTFAVTSILQP